MAAFRDNEFRDNEDFNWMGDMGESEPKSKKKGFLSGLFSTSPEEKARRKARKKSQQKEKARKKSQKKISKNMEKMRKAKKKCEKKGKKLSLNGKDCEEITPQPSSTASVNKRASIGRYGAAAYLASLEREQQQKTNQIAYDLGAETPPPSDDEWSDDDDDKPTEADILAAQNALRTGGGKRRRKRRRKTRRKKKRKSRRKSRKRKRKRKTKRRR